jgi:hypothetical protein
LETERKGKEAFLPYHLHCHHVIIVTIVGVVLKGVKDLLGHKEGELSSGWSLEFHHHHWCPLLNLGKLVWGKVCEVSRSLGVKAGYNGLLWT